MLLNSADSFSVAFGPFWTLLLHLRNETQNFRADFRIDPVVSAGICISMDVGILPLSSKSGPHLGTTGDIPTHWCQRDMSEGRPTERAVKALRPYSAYLPLESLYFGSAGTIPLVDVDATA